MAFPQLNYEQWFWEARATGSLRWDKPAGLFLTISDTALKETGVII